MEVARLTPFLPSTILFLLTSDYERHLKEELWLCHTNMKISLTELNNMSVLDRKNYIFLHNKTVERQKLELEKRKK